MTNRKKITVNLLNFTDDQLAGAAVFTRNIFAVSLKRLASDFDIEFYTSGIDARKVFNIPEHPGINIIRSSSMSIVQRIFFEQLLLPFKLLKSDIYFCPTPVLPFLVKFIHPKCRTLITIHDMIPFFVPKKYGKVRSLYVKWLSKYGARYADHVVTVSENSKADICRIAKVPVNKITVVYNFIPRAMENASDGHESYFLSISTIEPGKNIEGTLKAFRMAKERSVLKGYKFYWVGKLGWGYTQTDIDSLISSMELQNDFFITGYVDTQKKEDLLHNCTAMVYLSHYEGFGLPVLEALVHHKPAVVSNTSSLPEVVGSAGVICNLNNVDEIATGLEEIVINRSKYIREIPNQLLKFDPDLQGAKFCDLIAKVGSGGSAL